MAIAGIGSSYNQIGAATNYMQEKATVKDADRKMMEQPVSISISNEGKEHYRNNIQQSGQESYDAVLQRREKLKNEKISLIDYGYEISRRAVRSNTSSTDAGESVLSTADKADGYVKAYAELYDEIVQGYEDGTREIYVAGENGPRKLTKEEELDVLDAAYKKTVDSFVTMEQTNQHAREIISKEAEKLQKLAEGKHRRKISLRNKRQGGRIRFLKTLTKRCLSRLPYLRKNMRRFILMRVHYRSCWQALRFHSKEAIPQRFIKFCFCGLPRLIIRGQGWL